MQSKLDDLALHTISLSQGAVLETGCVYIVPLLESLELPSDIEASANPKSSTGRLDVFTRVITDGTPRFDEVSAGYRGPLYLEVSPQSFPVRAHAGASLNQLRLLEGEREAWSFTEVPANRLCSMSDDDRHGRGRDAGSCCQDTVDERTPCEAVQHFGELRLHPGALPGRQDDYVSISRHSESRLSSKAVDQEYWSFDRWLGSFDSRIDVPRRPPILLCERRDQRAPLTSHCFC